MLISLLTFLLISNALSLRKDKSILFSRIVMVSLILTSFLAFNNLFVMSLDKGIGLYGGLFHVTAFTQSFNIFIFLICATALFLSAVYYLNVIKYIFFFKDEYKISPSLENLSRVNYLYFLYSNNLLSIEMTILTLLLLFIYINKIRMIQHSKYINTNLIKTVDD